MRWMFALLLLINIIYFVFSEFMTVSENKNVSLNRPAVDLGEPIVLLSERSETDLAVVEEAKESVAVKSVASDPMCWMLGPFTEEISAKQVVGRLAALDITFTIKEYETAGKPNYWVHTPPKTSRKLAIKQLRELQRKKIDSFLITEGDLANGVSLGLFSEQARAQKLYKKRKNEGLEVELTEVPRIYSERWLVSEQGEYTKFSDQLWKKIKDGSKGIERRKNYCNKIASPEKLD